MIYEPTRVTRYDSAFNIQAIEHRPRGNTSTPGADRKPLSQLPVQSHSEPVVTMRPQTPSQNSEVHCVRRKRVHYSATQQGAS